jgi:hypothetical protein
MPRSANDLDNLGALETDLCTRISKLKSNHGPVSVAIAHLSHYLLAVRIHRWLGNRCDFAVVDSCFKDHCTLFNRIATPPSTLIPFNYRYPDSAYSEKYESIAKRLRHRFLHSIEGCRAARTLFERLPFVLSAKGEWRSDSVPLSVSRILLGRDENPEQCVFHPMLAEDFGLEVSLAGEASFAWSQGDRWPSVMIINNTSGHFMPMDWEASAMLDFLRNVAEIPSGTTLFCVTFRGGAFSFGVEGA